MRYEYADVDGIETLSNLLADQAKVKSLLEHALGGGQVLVL